MRKALRIVLIITLVPVAAVVALLLIAEVVISVATAGRTYSVLKDVPARDAALVLGTAKFVPGGDENVHYRRRINAAAELYRAGKVEFIIVSGNGAEPNYSEPDSMQEDLEELGVPSERILRDDFGLRTLDSVVRADVVFNAGDCIVISQPAHVRRAVFLGRARNQDIIGFEARDVSFATDPRTAIRESLARVLAVADAISNRQPQELGGPAYAEDSADEAKNL